MNNAERLAILNRMQSNKCEKCGSRILVVWFSDKALCSDCYDAGLRLMSNDEFEKVLDDACEAYASE